ncbi:endonuclease/exonuclease/phosphatase family protein [Membranihabitans marinus]|uniref:endonuclease/exonuclease/phosphatase family protein n=1 Tax=Membranihabitans marinus TaxID=1227546 RepID=UPI001F26CEEC|nr:endonuclease/exonuclease/phosphatase family protein [Membranihabitans marinus]
MRIITWNCNGAFRDKFNILSDFNADLYVIQECENPAETQHKGYKQWTANYLWIGDTKNKGLGIFAKNNIELKRLNWSNQYKAHKVKYFLPCSINNDFDLLAVWNHRNHSTIFEYIGQFWIYLQINKLKLNNSLIIGDFNSNKIWDKWDRWWNHSNVVAELKEIGIESLYHYYWDEEQGSESNPTFYMHRKLEKPYHIDYAFGSKEFLTRLKTMQIGAENHWLKFSDHLPIICEFE